MQSKSFYIDMQFDEHPSLSIVFESSQIYMLGMMIPSPQIGWHWPEITLYRSEWHERHCDGLVGEH